MEKFGAVAGMWGEGGGMVVMLMDSHRRQWRRLLEIYSELWSRFRLIVVYLNSN